MTIRYDVLNRVSNKVQFTAHIDCDCKDDKSIKIGLAVRWAIKSGADLSGANLSGADLSGAYLNGANLSGANLSGANLSVANLYKANLYKANLSGANLSGANLNGADLYKANLSGANLYKANLSGADLNGADLSGAIDADYAIACTRILPDGDLIGWKKCKDDVIVKLRIPESARRSHAFGRKCRAEYADVIEVIGAAVAISEYNTITEYKTGKRIMSDKWCDNWQEECSNGIHFYITRAEAEAH